MGNATAQPEAPAIDENTTAQPEAPAIGGIRLKAPGASVSWGGTVFDADEDGVVTVPADAIADLLNVGCEPT